MLKVEGLRPTLSHHDLMNEVVYALLFESGLAQDEQVHVLQSRQGVLGWTVRTESGKTYYFRPAPKGAVAVFDSYRGNQIGSLHTGAHVRKYMRMIRRSEGITP